jgi:hypothetical protein
VQVKGISVRVNAGRVWSGGIYINNQCYRVPPMGVNSTHPQYDVSVPVWSRAMCWSASPPAACGGIDFEKAGGLRQRGEAYCEPELSSLPRNTKGEGNEREEAIVGNQL